MACDLLRMIKRSVHLCVAVTVATLSIGSDSKSQVVDLLPDIFLPIDVPFTYDSITWFPTFGYDIVVNTVIFGRTHLRPTYGMANIGLGPIEFGGVFPYNADSSLDVIQRIHRSDGTYWERPAGQFRYDPEHAHIHMGDWAQPRIREVTPEGGVGDIIVEGKKQSWCVGNSAPYDTTLPHPLPYSRYQLCQDTLQGISVGWMDVYPMLVPGREIDITDIPNGRYWLEGEFDPEGHFLESDTTNNVSQKLITLCHNSLIAPEYDSMWMSHSAGLPGGSVKVDVMVSNEIPLSGISVPFTWAGPVGLVFDSTSLSGTRSELLATLIPSVVDNLLSRTTMTLVVSSLDSPGFLPGQGPVLSLYFTIPSDQVTVDTSEVVFTSYGSKKPFFDTFCDGYAPTIIANGSVTSSCCNFAGDANNSGTFSISDATFVIAYIFSGGASPDCLDEADSNGDGAINISDATYSIATIFQGGSLPVCREL